MGRWRWCCCRCCWRACYGRLIAGRRGAASGQRGDCRCDFKWLLALCYLGTLTHPLFDWFNNYGIRLLEPFSSQWFYGDTLFIIDPWIIAMLGAGVWLSLRRERGDGWNRHSPAFVALCSVATYVLFNALLSISAVGSAREIIAKSNPVVDAPLIVANAMPLAFWRREILWRGSQKYGRGDFDPFDGGVTLDRSSVLSVLPPPQPGMAYFSDDVLRGSQPLANFDTKMSDPRIAAWAKSDPAAQAFLFWSRMPIAELHPDHIVLRDQRFMDPRVADQFSVTLRKPDTASYPE